MSADGAARSPYRRSRKKGNDDRVFTERAIPLPQHIDELSDRKLLAFANFLSNSGAQVFKSRLDRAMTRIETAPAEAS